MLRPRKKIIKKEIKEDALVTYYFKAQKLFSAYSKQIQIGLISVLVLTVLGVLMVRSKKKAEIEASGKLGPVEQYYYMGDYQRAIPELNTIKDKYSGTPSAGVATFFLANAYVSTGNMEQAEKYYRLYIDNYGQNRAFSASSLAGLAACYESKKQYGQAAKMYEQAGTKYPELYSAPFNLKEAGRCYAQANDKAKAKSVYRFLLKNYQDTAPAQDAELRLAVL